MKVSFKATFRGSDFGFESMAPTKEAYMELPVSSEAEKLPNGYKDDEDFIQVIRTDSGDDERYNMYFLLFGFEHVSETVKAGPGVFIPREEGEEILRRLKIRNEKISFYKEEERKANEEKRRAIEEFMRSKMEFMKEYPHQIIEF